MSSSSAWVRDKNGLYRYLDRTNNAWVYQSGERVPVTQANSEVPRNQHPTPQSVADHPLGPEYDKTSAEYESARGPAAAGKSADPIEEITSELDQLGVRCQRQIKSLDPQTRSGNEGDHETDQRLAEKLNAHAAGVLRDTNQDRRVLDSSYRLQTQDFFVQGKIIMALWSQPAGNVKKQSKVPTTSKSHWTGEMVYTEPQRFMVIRSYRAHCLAVIITTYSKQGLAKSDIDIAAHAVVYKGKNSPSLSPDEKTARAAQQMLFPSIRIKLDDKKERLNTMSRINFGKVYTLEYNVKVKPYGRVATESLNDFQSHWYNVMMRDDSSGSSSRGSADPRAFASQVSQAYTAGASPYQLQTQQQQAMPAGWTPQQWALYPQQQQRQQQTQQIQPTQSTAQQQCTSTGRTQQPYTAAQSQYPTQSQYAAPQSPYAAPQPQYAATQPQYAANPQLPQQRHSPGWTQQQYAAYQQQQRQQQSQGGAIQQQEAQDDDDSDEE